MEGLYAHGVVLNWSSYFHITHLQKCFHLTPPISGILWHDSVIRLSTYKSIAWLVVIQQDYCHPILNLSIQLFHPS